MNNAQFYSQLHTLAAGAITPLIPIVGNTILLTANSSTGYTTDIAVKIDQMGFRNIPTGTKITPEHIGLIADRPKYFNSLQFKNTGSGTVTFHVLALMGDAANYNMQFNGAIDVQGAGQPVGRAAISAVVGGTAAVVSADAKAVSIQPKTNGVIVEVGGNVVANIGVDDFMTFPWSDVTLTLKGDGGTSTVYLAEVQ